MLNFMIECDQLHELSIDYENVSILIEQELSRKG